MRVGWLVLGALVAAALVAAFDVAIGGPSVLGAIGALVLVGMALSLSLAGAADLGDDDPLSASCSCWTVPGDRTRPPWAHAPDCHVRRRYEATGEHPGMQR